MANLGMLYGLGAGIGQAAQNFEQMQQQALRRQAIQQTLQQAQREQDVARQLGGLIQRGGFGDLGGGGGFNLPGSQRIAPMPTAGGMPGAPAPSVAPQAPPASYGAAQADIATNPMYSGGRYQPERDTGQGIGAAGDNMAIPLDAPTSQGARPASQAPASPAADPAAADAVAASSGGLSAMLPNGQQVPIEQLIGHRIGFSDVAKIIQQKMPGVDPETAWLAAEKLFKMTNQDNTQQRLYGLGVLKELGVITGLGLRASEGAANRASREGIAAGTQAGATERAGMTIGGRAAEGAANRESREGIAGARIAGQASEGAANRASREGIAAAARDARAALGSANREAAMQRVIARLGNSANPAAKAQLQALRSRRQSIMDQAGGAPNKQQLDALAQIDGEIINIADREARRLGAGQEPAAPAPATP